MYKRDLYERIRKDMNFECEQSDCMLGVYDRDFLLIYHCLLLYRNVVRGTYMNGLTLCHLCLFVYLRYFSIPLYLFMCTRRKWNNIVPMEYIRGTFLHYYYKKPFPIFFQFFYILFSYTCLYEIVQKYLLIFITIYLYSFYR